MASMLASQMGNLRVSNTSVKSFQGFKSCGPSSLSAPLQARTYQVTQRGSLQILAARVANVEIPNSKRVLHSLQYVYGIGHTTADKILADLELPNKRTFELTEEELTQLRGEVDKYVVEGDLRRQVAMDIRRLKEIGCYRGRRHWAGLPVRGQRTKNNARTRKGKSVAIPGKKK